MPPDVGVQLIGYVCWIIGSVFTEFFTVRESSRPRVLDVCSMYSRFSVSEVDNRLVESTCSLESSGVTRWTIIQGFQLRVIIFIKS